MSLVFQSQEALDAFTKTLTSRLALVEPVRDQLKETFLHLHREFANIVEAETLGQADGTWGVGSVLDALHKTLALADDTVHQFKKNIATATAAV